MTPFSIIRIVGIVKFSVALSLDIAGLILSHLLLVFKIKPQTARIPQSSLGLLYRYLPLEIKLGSPSVVGTKTPS